MRLAAKQKFAALPKEQDSARIRGATTAVFLCTAVCVTWALLKNPYDQGSAITGYHAAYFAAMASPFIFLVACVRGFFRRRLDCGLGLVASLAALPWFLWTEWSAYPWSNAWIALNVGPDWVFRGDQQFVSFAKLEILSVSLIVISIFCSLLRLLPSRWTLRKSPLRERTWPAFATCFVLLAAWFVSSASPYRVPLIVDAVPPWLRILHVEKRGLLFHETTVMTYRDAAFWISRNDRRLFQYQFEDRVGRGVMPESVREHVRSMMQSPALLGMRTAPPKALRSWNAEGWYVVLKDSEVLAFSSEYKTSPPQDIMNLFHEIEALPTDAETPWSVQDVCLGFCYDPLAGLGFRYSNSRCFTNTDGYTRCR